MWSINKLRAFIDISTYCNAACPQCHRTNHINGGLGKVAWLPRVQWTIEQIKNAYPPHIIRQLKHFDICGTWGDPVMNKDIINIVKYFIEENENIAITIDTNGSLRTEDFWWDLGIAGGKNLTVTFAVDGINQEMHAKYRRGTDLQKVLNNMQTVSMTQAKPTTFTVVFKHNEDYLDDIRIMTDQYGSKRYRYTISDRTWTQNPGQFVFNNEENKIEILEKSNLYVG